MHEMARSGEAVAGDVGDRGVQGRQRASVGILSQQPDRNCGKRGRAATSGGVDVRCDKAGMRRRRQHARPCGAQPMLQLRREQQVRQF